MDRSDQHRWWWWWWWEPPGAVGRHPSYQMCRGFYRLSVVAVILHTCWTCRTVAQEKSWGPGQWQQLLWLIFLGGPRHLSPPASSYITFQRNWCGNRCPASPSDVPDNWKLSGSLQLAVCPPLAVTTWTLSSSLCVSFERRRSVDEATKRLRVGSNARAECYSDAINAQGSVTLGLTLGLWISGHGVS